MARMLQIVVQIHEVPDPESPMRAAYQLAMQSSWMINGQPQPCEDNAIVISALKQAFELALSNVPFRPPTVLQVVPGAEVPTH